MKKAIVLLLALAFIGGAAFAEDPTVIKFADPDVTAGVSVYFGLNALAAGAGTEPGDKTADLEVVNLSEFGDLVLNGDSYSLVAAPWIQMKNGIFTTKLTGGYWGTSASGGAYRGQFDLQNSVSAAGVTVTNRLRARTTGTVGNTTTLTAAFDNVSARAVFDAVAGGQTTFYGAAFGILQTATNTDWDFQIKDFFDGFMDVKVGGKSTSYYHYNNFRPTAIGNYLWRSNSNTQTAKRWIGTDAMVPIVTEYSVGALAESVPLTLKTGFKVPATAMTFRDYFEGYNNVVIAANYPIEGIGAVDVGWLPGFAASRNVEAAGVYSVETRKDVVVNTFFLDFGLTAVEGLDLQAGFEIDLGAIKSAIAADTTGTGTAADPFVYTYVPYNEMNIGVEFVYDLAAVLAGLEVNGALALATGPGYTVEQDTGVAFVAAPVGNSYVAANYTEANVYKPAENLIIAIGANYALNDNNSFSFSNTFTGMAGDLNDTWATAYGYYNTNAISLGYTNAAGKGELSVTGYYTLYMGIPTAADQGITGVSNIATYDALVKNTFSPFSVEILYSAAY